MHDLIASERSPKVSLHNEPMFENLFALAVDHYPDEAVFREAAKLPDVPTLRLPAQIVPHQSEAARTQRIVIMRKRS